MVGDQQKIFGNLAKYIRKRTPEDNEKYKNEENKFEKYFKENL